MKVYTECIRNFFFNARSSLTERGRSVRSGRKSDGMFPLLLAKKYLFGDLLQFEEKIWRRRVCKTSGKIKIFVPYSKFHLRSACNWKYLIGKKESVEI